MESTSKIQPWKALSPEGLVEDQKPDIAARNLDPNDQGGGFGASVSKPADRKIRYQGWKVEASTESKVR